MPTSPPPSQLGSFRKQAVWPPGGAVQGRCEGQEHREGRLEEGRAGRSKRRGGGAAPGVIRGGQGLAGMGRI